MPRRWSDSDAPVGTPTLPIFDAEQLAQSDSWVADYVNVPLDQMMPFKENILDQPLVPEPPVARRRRCTPSSTRSCRPC